VDARRKPFKPNPHRRQFAIGSNLPRSTRPMDGRPHRKKVAKSHEPMRMLTKPPAASGEDAVSGDFG
jgi:hypothetical protein